MDGLYLGCDRAEHWYSTLYYHDSPLYIDNILLVHSEVIAAHEAIAVWSAVLFCDFFECLQGVLIYELYCFDVCFECAAAVVIEFCDEVEEVVLVEFVFAYSGDIG